MVLLDVGQPFRCARCHFMCVATGPPIRGGPYQSHTVHSSDFFGLDCFAVSCHFLLWWHKTSLGWFYHPEGGGFNKGGGFIPHKGWLYPPKVVVLSPKKGGFIPHKSGDKTSRGGFKGGFNPHLGVVLCRGPPAWACCSREQDPPGHCLLVTAPSAHHTTPHHTTPHHTTPHHTTSHHTTPHHTTPHHTTPHHTTPHHTTPHHTTPPCCGTHSWERRTVLS